MTSGLKGEGPFGDTPGTGVWRSMLTEQYSKNFAQAGGVGISSEVFRTLILQQAKTQQTKSEQTKADQAKTYRTKSDQTKTSSETRTSI
jgi:flagellar protein FlgJ